MGVQRNLPIFSARHFPEQNFWHVKSGVCLLLGEPRLTQVKRNYFFKVLSALALTKYTGESFTWGDKKKYVLFTLLSTF